MCPCMYMHSHVIVQDCSQQDLQLISEKAITIPFNLCLMVLWSLQGQS